MNGTDIPQRAGDVMARAAIGVTPRFNDLATLAGTIAESVNIQVCAYQSSENVQLTSDDVAFALELVISCIKRRGIAR